MPIKNRPHFVPRSFKYRPDYYMDFFGRVAAVFTHPVKKVSVYLEVDADIWNHADPFDASGNLDIIYQTATHRRSLLVKPVPTLKEALIFLQDRLDDPHFGDRFKEPPVRRDETGGYRYLPKEEARKRLRRKGNGSPFRLTEEDRAVLAGLGYPKGDLEQIEEAANRSTYTVIDSDGNNLRAVNVWEAIDILGRETFLSGISRSAFHRTCCRSSEDGKTEIYFDSGALFR